MVNEKRRQVRARKDYKCCICEKPIRKGCDHIVEAVQIAADDGWRQCRRHIHCDAMLRYCAEKAGVAPRNISRLELRVFVNQLCDAECMQGFRHRCGHDGFSCGELYYTMRHRPGYRAIVASVENCKED